MAATVTVLNQKVVPGVGLFTSGKLNYSGTYPAGGESNAGLLAVLHGYNKVDNVQFLTDNDYTAGFDVSLNKVRIWRNIGGAPVELTPGAYPAAGSIPFTIVSRM